MEAPNTPKWHKYINIGSKIIFNIIPIAMILIKFFGLNGIWMSFTISSILKGTTASLIYRYKTYKTLKILEAI